MNFRSLSKILFNWSPSEFNHIFISKPFFAGSYKPKILISNINDFNDFSNKIDLDRIESSNYQDQIIKNNLELFLEINEPKFKDVSNIPYSLFAKKLACKLWVLFKP